MSYEIGTVLMHINGEWRKFRGVESIGWMICWSESEQRPYINECTGAAVHGEKPSQVTFV